MGRVKVTADIINKQKFEKALKAGMSDEQIINLFAINSGILYKWVKLVYETKHPLVVIKKIRAEGELAFRVSQLQLAKKNPAVSIWVDKTFYGSNDVSESDNTNVNDIEDLNPLLELLKEHPAESKKEESDGNSND